MKGVQRGVDPEHPSANRFRRLVELCGLSNREAADFLGISQGTVIQKMKGARGISASEEADLASLWRMIAGPVALDWSLPAGAVHRQVALWEMAVIVAGEPVPEGLIPPDGVGLEQSVANEAEEAERQRKRGPLKIGRKRKEGEG